VEGATVGSYRVLYKLGEGGMGAVYVAEHTLLGRKAAIKALLPELSAHKEIVQRFFNEAKAVTQITDPGIVQVFDFGYDSEGRAYIVMELLEGEAMDKRLARVGMLPPADAVRMMKQICASLGAAHAKGIIHRDLKPENLFIIGDPAVTGGERVKVLDFGIAKLSGNDSATKTRTGMMMGTPVYMSPEQCRGAGNVDLRSDVYSIGCVMMTMITGRPPFEGDGSGELIVAHMREAPPLAASRVPGMPPVIDQIIQRALAKEPAQRFQSMNEMIHALAGAEATLLGFTPPPGSIQPYVGAPGSSPPYVGAGGSRPPYTPAPGSSPPGYVPTPMPTPAPITGPHMAPTTLSSAVGQPGTGSHPVPTSRRGLMLGAAAVVLVAGIAVTILLATRSGSQPEEPAANPPAAADAGVASVPPPPAKPDAAAPAPVVDAALAAVPADAAAPPPVPADAATALRPDAGVKRPPRPNPGSGKPHGATPDAGVDRGD